MLADVSGAQKKLSGFQKTLGGIGTVAKVGAAGGVALLGTALTKGFSRLTAIENAQAKLQGLGHDAKTVEKIMGNASASVKGTAFGLDAAASTAAGAVAAGVKPGKDLERTLSLVGDAATIAGTDMGSMGAIFNKVASSDMIQGDVLAQLGDRGIPILQLLAKEMGVSAGEVKKLASEGKVNFETFQNAMEKGMGGAAQKSGDTLQGALANTQAALGRIGANLLAGIYPKITKFFKGAIGGLGKWEDKAKTVGAAIGEHLGTAMTKVGEWFNKAKPLVVGAFNTALPVITTLGTLLTGTLLPAVAAVVDGFFKYQDVIIPLAGGILAMVTAWKTYLAVMKGWAALQKAWTAIQAAFNAVMAMNPIGLVVIAVIGLVAALVIAYKKSDKFRAIVDATWKVVKNGAVKAFNATKAVVLAVWNWIVDKIKTQVTAIKTTIATIREVVAKVREIFGNVKQAVVDKFNEIVSWVRDVPSKIKNAIGNAKTMLKSIGTDIMQGLLDGIMAMWDKVSGKFKELTDKIPDWKGPRKRDKTLLTDVGILIMQGFIKGLDAGFKGVESTLKKVTDKIAVYLKRTYKDAAKRKKVQAAVNRAIADEAAALKKAGKRYERLASRLAKARAKLADAKKAYDDYKTSISDSAKAFGALGNLNAAFNQSAMADQMRARIAQVRKFTAMVKDLISKGLNKTMLNDLLAMGPEQGFAYAQALVDGGASGIKEMNQLQAELNTAADSLGTTGANHFYAAGVKNAQNLVNGLESKEAQMVKQVRRLAKKLAKALQDALNVSLNIDKATNSGKGKKSGRAVINETNHVTINVTGNKVDGKDVVEAINKYYDKGGKRIKK